MMSGDQGSPATSSVPAIEHGMSAKIRDHVAVMTFPPRP